MEIKGGIKIEFPTEVLSLEKMEKEIILQAPKRQMVMSAKPPETSGSAVKLYKTG